MSSSATPRIKQRQIDSPWRLSDGIALIEELLDISLEVHNSTQDWEDIQSASKRKRLKVGTIIEAVRARRVTLGRMPGMMGYRHFLVLKSSIDDLAKEERAGRTEPTTGINEITAASFARGIGMRADGWFHSLFEAGHVSGTWKRHPITNVRTLCLSLEDIEAFNKRFITPTQIRAETQLQRPTTCLAHLRKAGITPVSPEGRHFGALFLRKEVEPVLRRIRSQRPK